jgi:hypothetical protein
VVSSAPEFFARLFRGDRYRFEFGVRRGDRRWFAPPSPDSPILKERRQWLAQTAVPVVGWQDSAEPLLAETLGLFPAAFRSTCLGTGSARLRSLAAQWEPDFVLLQRAPSDEFQMVGSAVCFPSAWAPEAKLGQTVAVIHGPVPTLNEDLGPRIRNFLAKLPAGLVFERENWGLAAVPARNLHPLRGQPRLAATTPLAEIWLRVEHQAFCALPDSGGLLFLIHLTVHRLSEVLRNAEVNSAFRQLLETMPEGIASYKGIQPARLSLLRQLG